MPLTRVCVRVRPGGLDSKDGIPPTGTCCSTPGQYEVDSIIDAATSSSTELFTSVCQHAVAELVEGKSSCILVFGAPSTGKSFALEGPQLTGASGQAAGIVPRAADAIFGHLQPVPRGKYRLHATLSGLTSRQDAYVVDLLDPQAASITLREYSIQVATSHLTVMALDSMDDVQQYLRRKASPTAPATPHNDLTGSLSRRAISQLGPMHVMYSFHLVTRPGEPDEQVSTLTFVELIGQESRDAYGLRNPRNDEALQRQLSRTYAALTSVLLALRSSNRTPQGLGTFDNQPCPPSCLPPGLVPWRDSALTKWLQPVLTTAAVLVILATVSPDIDDVQDTMATLSYVSRLRSSAISVPSTLLSSCSVNTPGKTVTVSPSWASCCHNIAPAGSTLNPSNMKLGGSLGSGGARGRAAGTPYVARSGAGQVWGKQRLPQRPQSIGAGWERSIAHAKPHMPGHGHRSASATPRILANTLDNSATLVSAFSAPANELSTNLLSPTAAQQDVYFSPGQHITAGDGDSNHHTPKGSGNALEEQHRTGHGTSNMSVCHQSDALSSTVNKLRLRTSSNCDQHNAPDLGPAGLPNGSSPHVPSDHQRLGFHHQDSATRAAAFNFQEEADSGLLHGQSMSPKGHRHVDGSIEDLDNRIYRELQVTLRKRGVGVRAEALLDQLVQSLGAFRVQVEDAKSFQLRASQQQHALEAQVADARQDRAAAVAVIEGLQRELRDARSECATLFEQRRYFEERALAASGTSHPDISVEKRSSADDSRPDKHHHESHFRQEAENAATDDLRNGAGASAALDIRPGWVPVQEVLDAQAQASDARAEAFQAQQHAQEVREESRKGLQHLREQVHALAAKVAVQVPLDTNGTGSFGDSSSVAEAAALASVLSQVQCEMERLQTAESAAQKLASDLQATSIPAAVAKAQSTANSAAAEVAVERTKARELAAVVTELREQLDSEQKRCANADAAAKAAEQRVEALAAHSQSLEESVQMLEAAASAAADRVSVERSAQEEIHQKEMAEQQNRATSAAARLDGLQDDLAATQDQVSELHALNEALARDLSAKSQALENSEAALQDSGSRCTAAEQQLDCTTALIKELQQELENVREADRVHSMDAAQHAQAVTQLRCQRDALQERLASAQGTLGSAVAEADDLRAQVASRDTMLNHTWPLITTACKVLTSNLTVVTGDGEVSDAPSQDVNWGAAGQVDLVLSATREAMSAVHSAAAELVASADARAAVGVLRKAQEDASAKEESLQGELERCRAELANALATQDRAEQKLNEREQELKQLSDHLSSSEVSARELSKAHAAADAGRAAAEQSAAKANEVADTLQADLNQCRHILQARDMQVQTLASQFQEASHRLSVCEGEMAQLIAQLEISGGKVANSEVAAQEARLRVQQLESAAATAQETVERMQRANQDLIQTHTEKERSAAAEESRLQVDIEQLRTEAAAATRLIQSLEDRANAGDDAVAEVKSLRTEVAAATAARTEAERRLKESECKLQCARDEMEMMQDRVRQAQEESKEATAAADRMQKELAAAAATRRAIDASFERLDKARERTHSVLSGPQPRTVQTAPGLQQYSAATGAFGHGRRAHSPLSAHSGLSAPAAPARASSLGRVRARGCSREEDRASITGGNIGVTQQGPGVQSGAGALSQELSRRESGWRERVVGRGEARLSVHGGPKGASDDTSAGFKQSSTLSALPGQQDMSFAERLSATVQK